MRTLMQANSPKQLFSRFPEYDLSTIDLENHQWVIIERVLQSGTQEEVRWLFSTYKQEKLLQFLKKHGARKLSPKNMKFWSFYFDVPYIPKTNPLWNP